MFHLLLAIASSALVSIAMRLSGPRVQRGTAMLCVNYLICLFFAWVYTGFAVPVPQVPGVSQALLLGAVNGVLFLSGFVVLQWNIRRNGMVLSSTFMRLGLLVCMVVSIVLFREMPSAMHWVGFFLAVVAIVLINYQPGETAGSKVGLLIALLCGGLCDSMSKIFEELGNPALSDHFLMYTFCMALIACAALTAKEKEGFPGKAEWLFGAMVGIPNFFSAKFLLASLGDLPGIIVYPVYSVGTILVVTVTGVFCFRETLEKRQVLALGMILAALVLLNI